MATAADCKQAIEVEIPAGEVEREYERIARDWQRRARIPGFRPGKAPLSLVRQRYQGQIWDEVVQSMVPAYLRSTFEREQLEPVSRPAIEDLSFQAGAPIRFKASFEVVPPFDLSTEGLQVGLEPAAVDEAEVEQALQALRRRSATWEDLPADAPLAEGETAVVRYDRSLEGEAEPRHVDQAFIELGDPETLPEFARELAGASVGDRREFDIAYPADYANTEVAGRQVHFKLEVTGRKRRQLPELNDGFVRGLDAGVETVEALRARLRADLETEKKQAVEDAARQELIRQLLERHDFAVPDALVEKQTALRLERGLHSLAAQGVDLDQLKLDWAALRREQEQPARQQVKTSLILERLAGREQLAVAEDELRQEVERLSGGQNAAAVYARMQQNGALERLRSQLLQQKALNRLLARATGREPAAVETT